MLVGLLLFYGENRRGVVPVTSRHYCCFGKIASFCSLDSLQRLFFFSSEERQCLVPIFEIFSFNSKYFQLISNHQSLIGLFNGQLTWYCTRSKKLFHTNGQLLSQKWMHSALSVRDYDKRSKKEEYNISVQIKGRGIHSFTIKKYGGDMMHSKRHHSFFWNWIPSFSPENFLVPSMNETSNWKICISHIYHTTAI